MSNGSVFVRGACYVLGEEEADYTSITGLSELASRFRLTPNAELWGWGSIRTTRCDLEDLAARTGLATLRTAGIDASSVDALVLCSNRIPGPAEEHGGFVSRVLTGIGLGDIPCYGQYLNRCANLLAGLDVSRALVISGRYRQVLLITTDKVAAGGERISQFALSSDGAASCVVTSEAGDLSTADSSPADPTAGGTDRYELLGCATAQQTADLDWAREISSDLARQVNDRLLTPWGLKLGDIRVLAHANIFKPLVMMKERQAGFDAGQLYLDNIARIGHCFAADPLINLVDRAALGDIGVGSYCLLATSVPGSRVGALLRRVG
jgi:3-oxoacyl-[acyl-carrier-protein] synthase-3